MKRLGDILVANYVLRVEDQMETGRMVMHWRNTW
jgi:hypothetical protein